MDHFIYTNGCGILVSRCLKEGLTWAIDKRFQFTISYYTIPLRTWRLASVIQTILVIRTHLKMKKYIEDQITKGLLYIVIINIMSPQSLLQIHQLDMLF